MSNNKESAKRVRFRNSGNKYVAEYLGDKFVSDKARNDLVRGLAMFRILDEQEENVLGCISFTVSLLVGLTRTGFPENYKVESLVNLLHYLPFNLPRMKALYPSCYEYRFDSQLHHDIEEDGVYRINAEGTYEQLFQRLIFSDGVSNHKIQDVALEVMFNDWEIHPDTNVLVEILINIIPVAEASLIKNLKLLLAEEKIRAVTASSDPQKLISVGLKPQTIRELEGDIKPIVQSPLMIKNIYGPNFESTTHGANSPVTINIGEIETIFEDLQREIRKNPDLKEKDQEKIIRIVKELGTEVTQGKNPKKIAQLVEDLKRGAAWIWQKILANPYVSGIIIELLSKATLSQ